MPIVIAFTVIGVALLLRSFAATNTNLALEAEQGVLSGAAKTGDGAQFITLSTGTSNNAGAELQRPVKIMPVGDSITMGMYGTYADWNVNKSLRGGYRAKLMELIGTKFQYDFVGESEGEDVRETLPDKDHEGHGGWQLVGGYGGGLNSIIDSKLAQFQPDIILLHAGTNDLNGGKNATTLANEMSAFIDNLTNQRPGMYVLVSNLKLGRFDTNTFNSLVQNSVAQKKAAGKKVFFVDTAANWQAPFWGDDANALHPSLANYEIMGQSWYDGLQNNMPGLFGGGTTPTPTPTPSSTGQFRIHQGGIIDPEGKPFLPLGVNEFAGLTFGGFENPNLASSGIADIYKNTWRFNFLRIVTCPDGYCDHHGKGGGPTVQGADLDALVNTYTARKMVILLQDHGQDYPNIPNASQIEQSLSWYRQIAQKYKNNPYVWFGGPNEPMDGSAAQMCQTWVDFETKFIDAVRSQGAQNMFVANSGGFGQDFAGYPTAGPVNEGDSYILRCGQQLHAKGNVMFDVHIYHRLKNLDFADYFRKIHAKGMAVIMGEAGGDVRFGYDGPGDVQATDRFFQTRAAGVGIAYWSAAFNFPLVTSPRAHDIDPSGANLTSHGRMLWDMTRNPPGALPAGVTPPTQ